MKTQKSIIEISHDLVDNRFADTPDVKVEFVLKAFDKTYRGTDLHKRFGICLVIEGHEGRQVCQGPMVPGPWASTFGLCTVICSDTCQNTGAVSARAIEAGTEEIVEDGDLVRMDGTVYEIGLKRDHGNELRMSLTVVEDDDALTVEEAEAADDVLEICAAAAESVDCALTARDQARAIAIKANRNQVDAERRADEAEARVRRLEAYIDEYKEDARKLEQIIMDHDADRREREANH